MSKKRPSMIPAETIRDAYHKIVERMKGETKVTPDRIAVVESLALAFRAECGPEYAWVPLDECRRLLLKERKNGELDAVHKGHGPSKGWKNRRKLARKAVPKWLQDYYHTPHWNAFRLIIIQRDDGRCVVCNSPEDVQVHHRTYKRLWGERESDCYTLCDECHELFHAHRRLVDPPEQAPTAEEYIPHLYVRID